MAENTKHPEVRSSSTPAGNGAGGNRWLPALVIACVSGWSLFLGVVVWQPQVRTAATARPATIQSQDTPLLVAAELSFSTVGSIAQHAAKATRPATLHELKLIDLLLVDGNAAQAIFAYGRLHSPLDSPLHDQLRYRMAVARELLGQSDEAGDAYRRLVTSTLDPQIALAAKIGQARNWIRANKSELARPILAAAANHPALIAQPNQRLSAEIAHLFALAYMQHPKTTSERLLQDDAFVAVMPNWSPVELLELADSPKSVPSTARAAAIRSTIIQPAMATRSDSDLPDDTSEPSASYISQLQRIYKYADEPTAIQLAIRQRAQPLLPLLDQIASVAEIKLAWTDAARVEMQDRQVGLETPNISLSVAMDQILAWANLTWDYIDGTLQIYSASDLTEGRYDALLRASAGRLARQALASHSGGPLAPYTYLALGNLLFQEKSYDEAISVYQKVESQYAGSHVAVIAQANAAKALLLSGHHDEAIDMFFHVADGSHGDSLQSMANTYAGRLLLESGDTKRATRPLMRAVSSASFNQERVVPLITLASCYLMADNPHAAAEALMEGRDLLRQSRDLPTADFLSSLAGYRAATATRETVDRGRALIRSLGHVDTSQFFGNHLLLLYGAALQEVGLAAQTEGVYTEALTKTLPPWVNDEIRHRLATYWIDTSNLTAARDILMSSVETGTHDAAVRAAIRLAELEWSQNQIEPCLEACRSLLAADLGPPQQAEVLQIMGRVYEARQEYDKAAICFAGMLPGTTESGRPLTPPPATTPLPPRRGQP